MPGWKQDMIELADYAFKRLRTRVEGLDDNEYFWQPVEECWTIRPNDRGEFVGDWESPVWPAPFTTIAWRLGHIINNLFDPRYATQLGLTPRTPPPTSMPATAAAALQLLEEGFEVTRGYLDALDEDRLAETIGPAAGPWADSDRGAFVLHMLDELIHHSAEVGVLRDLYRSTQGANPLVDAILDADWDRVSELQANQPDLLDRARAQRADLAMQVTAQHRWDAVPLVVALGFPLQLPDGTTALHYAAAAGHLESVTLLRRAGCDETARDPLYRATPREWAEYFNQDAAAAALAQ